ncbi:E3 ubiquitin- ligase SINAT2-like [Olea europaea subsp. europaea]|uniref:E3 ubiquitin- ligase SINAT2-like n=1 Tax=Olea europaea subsp. europaea TaxID=158383 RepID=A0A8S0SIX1_OLEEU|nr:E3 ubiquitin- ligase SINAT2-like [Olea europaea subsp. europaea]
MATLYARIASPSYKIPGSQDTFPDRSRLRHKRDCRYCPYNCRYAGEECLVTGDIRFLAAHLKNDHKVQIFNCFGFQFCLPFEALNLGTAPVYTTFIRFMGDDQDANKFNYSLEVGGNGRKLTWYGVPRSIRDSYISVRDSLDGQIIQRNMALFFSGDTKTGRNFHCSCVVGGLVVCCPVVVCAKIAGSYIGRCPVLGKYHVDLFSCIVKACHCSQAS